MTLLSSYIRFGDLGNVPKLQAVNMIGCQRLANKLKAGTYQVDLVDPMSLTE